ncbi:uncharacterized protein METZ01_LOCUS12066, partial [marine metagenome]
VTQRVFETVFTNDASSAHFFGFFGARPSFGEEEIWVNPQTVRVVPPTAFLDLPPTFIYERHKFPPLFRSTRPYDVVVITRVLLNTCSVSDARKISEKSPKKYRDDLALLLRKCFLGLVCLISSFQRTLARGRLISEVSERLVGSPAFKAGGMGEPRPAGSIPVHLRQVCPFQ